MPDVTEVAPEKVLTPVSRKVPAPVFSTGRPAMSWPIAPDCVAVPLATSSCVVALAMVMGAALVTPPAKATTDPVVRSEPLPSAPVAPRTSRPEDRVSSPEKVPGALSTSPPAPVPETARLPEPASAPVRVRVFDPAASAEPALTVIPPREKAPPSCSVPPASSNPPAPRWAAEAATSVPSVARVAPCVFVPVRVSEPAPTFSSVPGPEKAPEKVTLSPPATRSRPGPPVVRTSKLLDSEAVASSVPPSKA